MVADGLDVLGPQITQHASAELFLEFIEDATIGSPGIWRALVECLGGNELIDQPAKTADKEGYFAGVDLVGLRFIRRLIRRYESRAIRATAVERSDIPCGENNSAACRGDPCMP